MLKVEVEEDPAQHWHCLNDGQNGCLVGWQWQTQQYHLIYIVSIKTQQI